jgi:hypothetical protein
VATIVPDKNEPKQHLLGVAAAMANPLASLVTSRALVETVNPDVKVVAKVSHRVVHVWAMPLFVRSATRWNLPKMPCVVWQRKRMVKC